MDVASEPSEYRSWYHCCSQLAESSGPRSSPCPERNMMRFMGCLGANDLMCWNKVKWSLACSALAAALKTWSSRCFLDSLEASDISRLARLRWQTWYHALNRPVRAVDWICRSRRVWSWKRWNGFTSVCDFIPCDLDDDVGPLYWCSALCNVVRSESWVWMRWLIVPWTCSQNSSKKGPLSTQCWCKVNLCCLDHPAERWGCSEYHSRLSDVRSGTWWAPVKGTNVKSRSCLTSLAIESAWILRVQI